MRKRFLEYAAVALFVPAALLAQSQPGKEYLAKLQTLCDQGDMARCTELAYAYRVGVYGAVKNEQLALDLEKRACDRGFGGGCLGAAVAYDRGWGVKRNPSVAMQWFAKGCRQGDALACENQALRLARGEGTSPDPVRAVSAWQRGCDLGKADVCRNLAIALENGDGVARDVARALTLHVQACLLTSYASCVAAGRLLSAAANSDPSEIVALYTVACARGFDTHEACVELGDMYRDGRHVPRDPSRALTVYKRGCDASFVPACRSMRAMKPEPLARGVDEKLADAGYLVSFPATIYPSLPPVRFRMFGDDYGVVQRIDVFEPRGRRILQRISWPADQDTGWRPYKGTPNLDTPDLNFDGYNDLTVMSWAGATGNAGSMVWIYDPIAHRFVHNRTLSRLSNLEPEPARTRLVTFWTGGAAGMICSAEALKWLNGRPIVVTRVDQHFDDKRGTCVRTVRELRNGRLVRTKRESCRPDAPLRPCAVP